MIPSCFWSDWAVQDSIEIFCNLSKLVSYFFKRFFFHILISQRNSVDNLYNALI